MTVRPHFYSVFQFREVVFLRAIDCVIEWNGARRKSKHTHNVNCSEFITKSFTFLKDLLLSSKGTGPGSGNGCTHGSNANACDAGIGGVSNGGGLVRIESYNTGIN